MGYNVEQELLRRLSEKTNDGLAEIIGSKHETLGDANAAIRGAIRKAVNGGKEGSSHLIGKVLNGFNYTEWEASVLNDVIPTLNEYYK